MSSFTITVLMLAAMSASPQQHCEEHHIISHPSRDVSKQLAAKVQPTFFASPQGHPRESDLGAKIIELTLPTVHPRWFLSTSHRR